MPSHDVWVGHGVIGRNSTKRLAPRCRSWSRIFGEKTDPPIACPPSWESWSTGRAIALPVSSLHGWSVCPPTDLVFVVPGSAGADPRLEPYRLVVNCLVSFGGLAEKRPVVCRRRAPLVGHWEWDLNKETPTSWGRLPLASSYSPGGSGVVVHSLGTMV